MPVFFIRKVPDVLSQQHGLVCLYLFQSLIIEQYPDISLDHSRCQYKFPFVP